MTTKKFLVPTLEGPISPIDGRYKDKTIALAKHFSEEGLMFYRIVIEVEYAYRLTLPGVSVIRKLLPHELRFFRNIYRKFSREDFEKIKKLEETSEHDVKAVEYFIHSKLRGTSLEDIIPFIHIGRTSEDINNLAQAFMIRYATSIILSQYEDVMRYIARQAEVYCEKTILALTHGQGASPTTFGWEMYVHFNRLRQSYHEIKNCKLSVKLNGATGGNNALVLAYPEINWRKFAEDFVKYLNVFGGSAKMMQFENNVYTTQIEPHDTYARYFSKLIVMNNILIDFSVDMWMYISRGIVIQKAIAGEVGSTAMPHKVNPINFENAEGNLGLANNDAIHYVSKLTKSRMQRDLSDSTVIRYFGETFAKISISCQALSKGMKKVSLNEEAVFVELNKNWGVVSEAYQVVLRKHGIAEGYEMLKDLTRGGKIEVNEELMHSFVQSLQSKGTINKEVAHILYSVTPFNYKGDRSFTVPKF